MAKKKKSIMEKYLHGELNKTKKADPHYRIDKALDQFVMSNCVPAYTADFAPHEYRPPYIDCEIRIVLNADGKGYIHLLGQDSETVDFDLSSKKAHEYYRLPFPYDALKDVKEISKLLANVMDKMEKDPNRKFGF